MAKKPWPMAEDLDRKWRDREAAVAALEPLLVIAATPSAGCGAERHTVPVSDLDEWSGRCRDVGINGDLLLTLAGVATGGARNDAPSELTAVNWPGAWRLYARDVTERLGKVEKALREMALAAAALGLGERTRR